MDLIINNVTLTSFLVSPRASNSFRNEFVTPGDPYARAGRPLLLLGTTWSDNVAGIAWRAAAVPRVIRIMNRNRLALCVMGIGFLTYWVRTLGYVCPRNQLLPVLVVAIFLGISGTSISRLYGLGALSSLFVLPPLFLMWARAVIGREGSGRLNVLAAIWMLLAVVALAFLFGAVGAQCSPPRASQLTPARLPA